MSNTQTSLSAMSLIQHVRLLLSDAGTAIKEMPNWEKPVHVFWLLGPFILLIERSPADIWLSSLAVIFATRALWQRDGRWLRHVWVRAAFMFWAVCLLSAAFSTAPGYALGEAFSWFRFPLFAMATVFWLGKDRRLIYLMLLSTGVGMMVMTGILTAEMLIEGQKNGRLVWPYGDLNPGNYLAKAGMPAFCVMVAFAFGARGKTSLVMGALVSFSLALSVLSGERINLILRVCAGLLSGVSWRFFWSRYVLFAALVLAILVTVSGLQDGLEGRFTTAIANDLPTGSGSDYYRKMGGGVMAFLEAPLLGIGTANYRDLCADILPGEGAFRCDNHPHNYYIQMLAETGILGFITGVFMICTIIWTLFRAGRANNQNVAAATAFIVPLGLFFPLQSTADFFGQWNNIFMWSAVALSMASVNLLPTQNQTHK
ncbi:O-antigen ligase family protein [Alphaproteobacteria bacterium]|nr:O-antigen ligase family protein [Alphaproteobacteria bacterium]